MTDEDVKLARERLASAERNPDNHLGEVLVDAADIAIVLRALDERTADLERERMRLAACGVVAMANTPETATRARDMHADYWSASCADVVGAVDREMSLRAELAERTAERDEARGDLTQVPSVGLLMDLRTALADAQAREGRHREALAWARKFATGFDHLRECEWFNGLRCDCGYGALGYSLDAALSTPADMGALREFGERCVVAGAYEIGRGASIVDNPAAIVERLLAKGGGE